MYFRSVSKVVRDDDEKDLNKDFNDDEVLETVGYVSFEDINSIKNDSDTQSIVDAGQSETSDSLRSSLSSQVSEISVTKTPDRHVQNPLNDEL